MIDLMCNFFVVSSGNPGPWSRKSNRVIAPNMSLLDLGAPGNSLGDVYHFSAPLHSERGGPVTGEVIGSKTLVKVATDADPNLERRATLLFFTFADRKDQIIAFGVADYSPSAPEFDAGQSVV